MHASAKPQIGVDRAPLVSVIMPCLNEAGAVGICVQKAVGALEKLGVTGEVIVVDNGSEDESAHVAAAAGARVVYEARRGYGAAYLRGFAEARGEYLVMGDADDTYDFTRIPDFLKPLLADEADLVMGTRLKGEILEGAMPWSHRWIGNPVLSGMLKVFFKTSVSDSHCGMRAMTRPAYDEMHLHTTGMEFASEMVVSALRNRLRIEEIPITYHPRIGESKLSGIHDGWRHIRFMLLYSPTYLFLLPGLALIAVGAVLVLALAGGPRDFLGRTWNYHPLLFGAIAVMLGYTIVMFDIFAKTYSMKAGFARPRQWLRRLTTIFTLEKGVLIGLVFFLAGLGIEFKIVTDWVRSGYGELQAVKGIVIGMLGIVVGAQTIFASFLLSLFLIERE